ncbi:hypothetical protein GCM10018785_02540 [Streptomyces longispororuber]|uniref:Secreted protein n=1 Tax=Streptomyces longispororuber TaxID=68230 RepID=A0A919DEV1_9ACTN|nr:hypothetical protein GCM10018785_02540 [Streptomyces longispororuber]
MVPSTTALPPLTVTFSTVMPCGAAVAAGAAKPAAATAKAEPTTAIRVRCRIGYVPPQMVPEQTMLQRQM